MADRKSHKNRVQLFLEVESSLRVQAVQGLTVQGLVVLECQGWFRQERDGWFRVWGLPRCKIIGIPLPGVRSCQAWN